MKTKFTLTFLLVVISICTRAQWVACNVALDNNVWGSCVYNGELYACGNFENADTMPALAIARWNGSVWHDVGGGFQHGAFSYVVRGMIVYNNELIAGGYVDSAGGNPVHKVAKWNGTSWSAMGTDCPISTVTCFGIHNGELYVGGQASGALKVCVAKWTGTNWLPLDTEGGNINVYALISYNGQLYAGGSFSNFNNTGAAGIARWNGSSWSDIGSGGPAVNALAVYNNKLFIGGSFTTAGGVSANNIVSWDGTTWSALQGGVNTQVQSLLSYGGKLFVGGTFWMVNSTTNANRAAYWDGSAWTVLGTDLGSGAKTIAAYNSEIYYGGEGAFNGQHYFAKWSGGTFNGISENENNTTINVLPNPFTDKVSFHLNSQLPEKLSIVIFSSQGQKVFENQTMLHDGEVDLSQLQDGIYFFNLKTEKYVITKAIVKM